MAAMRPKPERHSCSASPRRVNVCRWSSVMLKTLGDRMKRCVKARLPFHRPESRTTCSTMSRSMSNLLHVGGVWDQIVIEQLPTDFCQQLTSTINLRDEEHQKDV